MFYYSEIIARQKQNKTQGRVASPKVVDRGKRFQVRIAPMRIEEKNVEYTTSRGRINTWAKAKTESL